MRYAAVSGPACRKTATSSSVMVSRDAEYRFAALWFPWLLCSRAGQCANGYAVAANEPTEQLLRRIRGGEEAARQALYERCLPLLRRWAHGRLPHQARDIADTDDLVQITLIRALRH